MRDNIANLDILSISIDIVIVTTLITIYKKSEFDIIKVILDISDYLTIELVIK